MPYSGDPSTSAADQVRFMLGDTDAQSALLTDSEVSFLVTQAKGDPVRAAIAGCYAILAKLSPAVDESVGSVSVSISQRRANYVSLLSSLQAQRATSGLQYRAYAGGVSWADKVSQALNPDRVQPQFRRRNPLGTLRPYGLPRGVPGPVDEGGW